MQLPKCFSARQEPGKSWKKRRKRLKRPSKRPKRMTRARPKSPKMAKRPGLKALKALKRKRSQLDPKHTKHRQARNRNCQRKYNSCSCWAALKTSVWNLKVLHKTRKTLQILNSHRLLPLTFRPRLFTFGVSQCSKHCRSLQASSPAPNSQRLGLAEHSQISIVASFAKGSFLLNCQCPAETWKTQGMPTNKAGCRYTTHLHGNKRSDVFVSQWFRYNFVGLSGMCISLFRKWCRGSRNQRSVRRDQS